MKTVSARMQVSADMLRRKQMVQRVTSDPISSVAVLRAGADLNFIKF